MLLVLFKLQVFISFANSKIVLIISVQYYINFLQLFQLH